MSKLQPPLPLVGVARPKTGPWPEALATFAVETASAAARMILFVHFNWSVFAKRPGGSSKAPALGTRPLLFDHLLAAAAARNLCSLTVWVGAPCYCDFAAAGRIRASVNFALFESHRFPPFTFRLNLAPEYRVKFFFVPRIKRKAEEPAGRDRGRRSPLPPAPPEDGREGHNSAGPIEKPRQPARSLNHVQLEPDTQGRERREDKQPSEFHQCCRQTRASQTEKPRQKRRRSTGTREKPEECRKDRHSGPPNSGNHYLTFSAPSFMVRSMSVQNSFAASFGCPEFFHFLTARLNSFSKPARLRIVSRMLSRCR